MGKLNVYVGGFSTFGCIKCIVDGNGVGAIVCSLLAIINLIYGIINK